MKKDVRMISWNVHFPEFGKDSSFVVEKLEKYGPFDVICLQEFVEGADNTALKWLKENDYQVSYMGFASKDNWSQGVMMAIKNGMDPVYKQYVFRKDEPIKKRPFPNIRGMVSAKVLIDGEELLLGNTHLTYARRHTIDMRKREFKELVRVIDDDFVGNNWVICGDFNFFGKDERRKYLTMKYEYVTGGKITKTWRYASKRSPIGANIDYLFWDANNVAVEGQLAEFHMSDHRPIIASISIEQ